jgi:hypothetical protein
LSVVFPVQFPLALLAVVPVSHCSSQRIVGLDVLNAEGQFPEALDNVMEVLPCAYPAVQLQTLGTGSLK